MSAHTVGLSRHTPRGVLRGSRSTARIGIAFGAALTLVGAMSGVASAAPGITDDGTTDAHVIVTSAITLTALTPDFTLTGIPGATVTGTAAVTYNVYTNNLAGYSVTVQAENDTLDPVTAGNPDSIPIGALSVRETGTTTFTPVSNAAPVTVHTQATRSIAAGDALSSDYQVVIPFVNEDEYVVTLDYVATTL